VDSFDKLDLVQAAQAARMIQKAEGRIAELKDQLRSYIFFNGPLEEGGETLDLWPVNQRQINTVDAIHLLRKIGFPDDSIFGKLKITIADYESFGKGDKNNKERLKALITNKPITKMEWRKS
jgi:hypothetical protein